MLTKAFKVFTHDLRPPVQGGEPVFSGVVPCALPLVALDSTPKECGAGWNACLALETAVKIGGLWRLGRPTRAFEVEGEFISRGDKLRSAGLTVLRECGEAEVEEAVGRLSAGWFADLGPEMAGEQMAWRAAFARPRRDVEGVERGLLGALEKRGLTWTLKRYDSEKAARAARDAWDARAARAAWDAWDARAAWAARAARAARDAWAAWDAWDAWDARAAWDAWDARAAWDALTVHYAALRGWTDNKDPHLLSFGLRDAYACGLELAIPTGPSELGYVMAGEPK